MMGIISILEKALLGLYPSKADTQSGIYVPTARGVHVRSLL